MQDNECKVDKYSAVKEQTKHRFKPYLERK
jgi:hypothetical protein